MKYFQSKQVIGGFLSSYQCQLEANYGAVDAVKITRKRFQRESYPEEYVDGDAKSETSDWSDYGRVQLSGLGFFQLYQLCKSSCENCSGSCLRSSTPVPKSDIGGSVPKQRHGGPVANTTIEKLFQYTGNFGGGEYVSLRKEKEYHGKSKCESYVKQIDDKDQIELKQVLKECRLGGRHGGEDDLAFYWFIDGLKQEINEKYKEYEKFENEGNYQLTREIINQPYQDINQPQFRTLIQDQQKTEWTSVEDYLIQDFVKSMEERWNSETERGSLLRGTRTSIQYGSQQVY